MDILTKEICKELRQDVGQWINTFLKFDSKKGLVIKLTKELKELFSECEITNEVEFSDRFHYIRDYFYMQDVPIEFCLDNSDLYLYGENMQTINYGYGLTNAPLFAFKGYFFHNDELNPPKYIFSYFANYQCLDFIEILLKQGEVIFETFIDNSNEYNKFYEKLESAEIA
ncbi:hypothetical protein DCO58_11850 [Helicobacter saguini]|uniref:Uncharacterized protein n=1 Tax=Helicobacter saguini TaxID=1548018 RepID=A0A347VQA4_9HELI|nr:hypothetical protein [Helicobacter saguini]MWV61018.1 hypothetical protein [Helicobacter saguini]MWV68313.1 hypothetical protein [Helicobacter saguini]MWV70222.1 hypothetical protein [Helicobacter saguini]MWV72125.1 hypothetical protein [Helicobacter saguini]TLD91628.1 hypothetical protein LS64_011590 [Helicobacter saguini]